MSTTDEVKWMRKIADFMHCVDQIENAEAADMMGITLSNLHKLSGTDSISFIEAQDNVTATVSYAIPNPPNVTILDRVLFESIPENDPLYTTGSAFPELKALIGEHNSTVILPLPDDKLPRCVLLIWNSVVHFSPAFKEFISIAFSVIRRVVKLTSVFYSIEQLEAHFYAILQTVPQSVIFIDNSGRRSWVNERASRLFNLPSGTVEPALLANSMQSFINLADNRNEIYHRGMRLFQSGQKVTGNWKWIYSVPKPLVLNGYCTPVASRSVEGVLWMFDDITDKHFADQEINALNQKLKQASDSKSQFLANMSHELRTPLNSIIVLANLLKENNNRNLTSKQLNYAGVIVNSGKDLLYLIDDILDISKIEAGKMDLHFENENTKDIVHTLQGLFSEIARAKNIHFRVDVSAKVPESIMTDCLRLSQICKNLLSNAFKFTPEGGSVEFKMESNNDQSVLIFKVSDTGLGIEEAKKTEIFEAFKQADCTTSRNFGGTGLGLSITKELVWKFGGQVSVESTLGKGSTFIVEMPLLQEMENAFKKEEPDPIMAEATTELDADDYKCLKGRNILVAGDDIREVFSINATLTQCGVSASHALSAEELRQQLQQQAPEAVIIDAAMERFTVMDLMHEVSKNETPIRILVVSSTGILQKEHVEAGIGSVLRKPVNAIQLMTELQRLLTS